MLRVSIIILLCSVISLTLSAQDSSILSTILSKKYNLQYTVKSRGENIWTGSIHRTNNYLFARNEQFFAIQEDSFVFDMDTVLKMASKGPLTILGPLLAIPAYDPFQILEYTRIWRATSKQTLVRDTIIDTYNFPANVPINKVVIKSFSKGDLQIELDYQQLHSKRHDVVVYKFITEDSMMKKPRIHEFVEELDGRCQLKKLWQGYSFLCQ